ncbi:hypothetical protein [Actinomadura atramentaria]|uniref:hypothetical protein n=1 Tax=Actinomadura atramentaria TaxID=1990 RepID=UPI000369B326|nr:hypothetical protein [Actinomadura atramentaria]
MTSRDALLVRGDGVWRRVPPSGIELLRGGAGGNAHTLTAEPGACEWTTAVHDRTGLALGVLRASAPVYLIHAEHGASGIAPGEYAVRRQWERVSRPASGGFRYEFGADRMIAD